MAAVSWSKMSEEKIAHHLRESIKKAVDTYHRDWRLFQEPLQNAIDSFLSQETGEPLDFVIADGFNPTIEVEFNIAENYITISDNGSGIKREMHDFFTTPYSGGKLSTEPNDEDKKKYRRHLKGSQGIGAKATVYGSKYYKMDTKHYQEETGWSWEFEDLWKVPKDGEPEDIGEIVDSARDSHGTTIKVSEGYESEEGFTVRRFIEEKIRTWSKNLGLELRKELTPYEKLLEIRDELTKKSKQDTALNNSINKKFKEFKKINTLPKNTSHKKWILNASTVESNAWADFYGNEFNEKKSKLDDEILKIEEDESAIVNVCEEKIKQFRKEVSDEVEGFEETKKLLETFDECNTAVMAFKKQEEDGKPVDEDKFEQSRQELIEAEKALFSLWEREGEYKFYNKNAKITAEGWKADLTKVMRHYLLFHSYAGDLTRIIDGETTTLPKIKINLKITPDATPIDGIKTIEADGAELEVEVGYETASTKWNIESTNTEREAVATALRIQNRMVDFDDNWIDFVEKSPTGKKGQIFEKVFTGDDLKNLVGRFNKAGAGSGKKYAYQAPTTEQLATSKVGFGSALKRINGLYVAIANSRNLRDKLGLPTGAWISVNGLPTDIRANIEGKGDGGYKTSMHLVLDIDASLGIGKRNLGGEGPEMDGRIGNTMDEFMAHIFPNLVKIANILTENEEKEKTDRTIPFDPDALKYIEKDERREIMSKYFGRLTEPDCENDIIQMHNYWLGYHKHSINWLTVNGITEIDAVCDGEDTPLLVEYKGPDVANSTQSGVPNLIFKNKQKGNKQKFGKYHIAVVWDPPTAEKIEKHDEAVILTTYADDEEKEEYPMKDIFLPSAMFRLTKSDDSVFVFALKALLDTIILSEKGS